MTGQGEGEERSVTIFPGTVLIKTYSFLCGTQKVVPREINPHEVEEGKQGQGGDTLNPSLSAPGETKNRRTLDDRDGKSF